MKQVHGTFVSDFFCQGRDIKQRIDFATPFLDDEPFVLFDAQPNLT